MARNLAALPRLIPRLFGVYSVVGLKTVDFPLAGTTVFKQSPL